MALKEPTCWAAHYFTNKIKKSYYPVPSNSISFWDVPFLPPLPTAQMSDENQEYIREWARDNGKSVRQKTVRQEATKYKADVRPLDMYESHQTIGERIQFETPSSDNSNENQWLKSSATDLRLVLFLIFGARKGPLNSADSWRTVSGVRELQSA